MYGAPTDEFPRRSSHWCGARRLGRRGHFFEPKEPYKWQIFFAATLKGVLVALLTGFSLAATTRWWSAMVTGALYGLAFSLVIYLAKGGPKSGDAPYVIPSGLITGH